MRVRDKLNMEYKQLMEEGPITIVAFGDSVTHGAVASGQICYDTVYWKRLEEKLHEVRNYVPINVINAGIGGITAKASLDRMERQVYDHHPDLVIICFGLNDVNGTLEEYLDSLRSMFERAQTEGCEVIFLTPNMLNTYVAEDTSEQHLGYAAVTAGYQNEGRMDLYMAKAVELAGSMGVPVCDCYAKWKELSKTTDTTMLLANRINHPTREMHELFAQSLFEMVMGEYEPCKEQDNSTMYRE